MPTCCWISSFHGQPKKSIAIPGANFLWPMRNAFRSSKLSLTTSHWGKRKHRQAKVAQFETTRSIVRWATRRQSRVTPRCPTPPPPFNFTPATVKGYRGGRAGTHTEGAAGVQEAVACCCLITAETARSVAGQYPAGSGVLPAYGTKHTRTHTNLLSALWLSTTLNCTFLDHQEEINCYSFQGAFVLDLSIHRLWVHQFENWCVHSTPQIFREK